MLIATLGNRDVKLIENNELKDIKPARIKGEKIYNNLKQYIDSIKIPLLEETFKYMIYKEYLVDIFYLVVTDQKDTEFSKGDTIWLGKIIKKILIDKKFKSYREIPPELVNKNNLFVEFLPGQEFTVDILCGLQGNLVVAVPRSRLEVDRGISSRGKTEKRQDIIQYTKKICSILKFIGPINIQFKLNQEGKPRLMDVNPRMSGGFPITAASGVNSLELMINILKGEELPEISWEERESTHKEGDRFLSTDETHHHSWHHLLSCSQHQRIELELLVHDKGQSCNRNTLSRMLFLF